MPVERDTVGRIAFGPGLGRNPYDRADYTWRQRSFCVASEPSAVERAIAAMQVLTEDERAQVLKALEKNR